MILLWKRILIVATLFAGSLGWAGDDVIKPADLFSSCFQRAERLYQNSSATASNLPKPTELVFKDPELERNGRELIKKPNVFEFCEPPSRPARIMAKQFSDEWWRSLFYSGRGVVKENEVIDCDQLLANNPKWREVEKMDSAGKRIVMKRALDRFYDYEKKDKRNLACAICVGCNPDERLDGDSPHTALHLVSMRKHYGLFNLLLRKGANPNLKCQPAAPLEFVPYKWWKRELIEFGAKSKLD